MPEYEHLCHACQGNFEDFYSVHDPIPSKCPLCQVEGQIQRLISCRSKGKVEMSREELKKFIQNEAASAVQRARVDENYRANLIGEERYHNIQTAKDEDKRELKKYKPLQWGRRVG